MSTDDDTPAPDVEKPAPEATGPGEGERIAKVLSRAGVASRRDAERLILEGRVKVNGETVTNPATNVTEKDLLAVDDSEVGAPEATRLWLYHKPAGLVTTESDEEGRPTVFEDLPDDMPRVMSVGRLDMTSEGLLLLTNDGEIKRRLELPSTGWTRRYRVRIHGRPTDEQLEPLRRGVTVEEIEYQPMEVAIDRQQGSNAWLTLTLREGKNREIRRVMEHLGFTVNRLIRISYGPFQLGELPVGDVEEVRPKIVRDQLGLSKPEPSRTRKRADGAGAPTEEEPGEDRPERDVLSTARPAGATVKRALKPRVPGARGKGDDEEERGPRKPRAAVPSRKPSGDAPFRKPRTYMRADEARAARDEGEGTGRPRPTGYKSHGGEGGEERPRSRSTGYKSHGDRDARPPREGGDRGPRRFGDRPLREEGSDRPRGFKPQRRDGDEGGRPARPYKPREGDEGRPPRKYGGAQGERSSRPFKPREGEEGHPPRRFEGRSEGDRPARPYKPREGDEGRPPRKYGGAESDRGGRPFKPRTPREGGEGSSPARGFKPSRPPREGDEARPARGFRKPGAEGDDRRPPRTGGFKPSGPGGPRKGPARGRPGGRPSGPKPRKG